MVCASKAARRCVFCGNAGYFARDRSHDGPVADLAPNGVRTETVPTKLFGRILPSLVENLTTDARLPNLNRPKRCRTQSAREHGKGAARAFEHCRLVSELLRSPQIGCGR
jgi:hypothetical protein